MLRQRFDICVDNNGFHQVRFDWRIEMDGTLLDDPQEAIDFLKDASRTLALIRESKENKVEKEEEK